MSLMITEIYDALLSANADEEKAREAAKAVAKYDDNISDIKMNLGQLNSRMNLLQWMIGFNLAFTMAVLWKILG